jgi:hypothetical protein
MKTKRRETMDQKDIDSLTVAQVKELCALVEGKRPIALAKHPYEIGEKYFIRAVTYFYTGRLVAVTQHELVLEDACWIADTGRFTQALAKGEFGETEPFPPGKVMIGRGAIVDASIWKHALPTSQK